MLDNFRKAIPSLVCSILLIGLVLLPFPFPVLVATLVVGFSFSMINLLSWLYGLWQEDRPINFRVRSTIAHISLFIVENSLLTMCLLVVLPTVLAVSIPGPVVWGLFVFSSVSSMFYLWKAMLDVSEERDGEANLRKGDFKAAMERGENLKIRNEDLQKVVKKYANEGKFCSACLEELKEGDAVTIEYAFNFAATDDNDSQRQRELPSIVSSNSIGSEDARFEEKTMDSKFTGHGNSPAFIVHDECYQQWADHSDYKKGFSRESFTKLTLFAGVECPSLQSVEQEVLAEQKEVEEVKVVLKNEDRKSCYYDSNHSLLATPRVSVPAEEISGQLDDNIKSTDQACSV